jgi:hypothetical protein
MACRGTQDCPRSDNHFVVYWVEIDLAERVGFEPTVGYKPTHAFQACALNHSAISPPKARVMCRVSVWRATSFSRESGTPPAQRVGKSSVKKRSARREDCDCASFAPSRAMSAVTGRIHKGSLAFRIALSACGDHSFAGALAEMASLSVPSASARETAPMSL